MDRLNDGASEREHQEWREARLARLVGPRGALALTGTHWFTDELELDGVPGTWRAVTGSAPARATLTAGPDDDVLVDGAPPAGRTVPVRSDAEGEPTPVTAGRLQLVLVDREGVLAVRVYDPDAPARSGFEGVETFPYDRALRVPAVFEPYDEERRVLVPNVDGVERGLPLGGTVSFELAGTPVRLQVERDPDDGVLQAVFRDATGTAGAYPFRFVNFPPPDADGRTVADLNTAFLPPCAFSEHFVCPLPPSGNSLDVAVEAGERQVRWRVRDAPADGSSADDEGRDPDLSQ